MRTKITLILLVCILVGCTKNADIESVNIPSDPVTQTVLPKISKDISVLSADDAIKVANLFSHGKVLTKSETLKDVRNVVPIKDASDRTLMYAVNYDDGYAIVSATKNYHPVLAVVDHGTYAGEKTGTGQDVLMNEYMLATEAAMDGEISVDKSVWSEYEEVPFQYAPQTKVSDEYNDVVNQYTGEWYQAGYNIYRLNQKPENMPDDMYAEFCDYASYHDRPDHDYMQCSFIVEDATRIRHDILPMCITRWGQGEPYNAGLENTANPLGCATIATAQLMWYYRKPTSINWSNMPISLSLGQQNSTLTDFLAQLHDNLEISDGGSGYLSSVYELLIQAYGYNINQFNHNISMVENSLLNSKPVGMTGHDVYYINDEPVIGAGHMWVCDGFRSTKPQIDYYLYVIPVGENPICSLDMVHEGCVYDNVLTVTKHYHMNWGWSGNNNGYFINDDVSVRGYDFKEYRKNIYVDYDF